MTTTAGLMTKTTSFPNGDSLSLLQKSRMTRIVDDDDGDDGVCGDRGDGSTTRMPNKRMTGLMDLQKEIMATLILLLENNIRPPIRETNRVK